MLIFKKYTVPILLLSLVLGIAYLSYYNYKTQKNLLLLQMHNNSLNIANSVSSAIERFDNIKSTISLQKLVDDISFGLEIFEFRYIEPDGTIKNSMFKEEIGKILSSQSFVEAKQKNRKFGTFFFEVRDFVDVMSIYYPIYTSGKLVGIIDLAIDISEYDLKKGLKDNFSILRRQGDILNLLKSINGSIANSFTILTKTDINDFLHAYIDSTKNIKQISIIDEQNKVVISSDADLIGTKLNNESLSESSMAINNEKLTYRTVTDFNIDKNNQKMKLLLLVDASTYLSHENRLFATATITATIALLFALFTSRLIYFSAIEQSRTEKERLEHLVTERTKEIELLSKTDTLTGLWNRGYLEQALEKEFKRARRYNHELSIMIIDLDHFKRINDTYGHMAGDEVLRKISIKIKSCQRETDFIGRYGGEEIVVILPETNLEKSIKVANDIREAIAQEPIIFESYVINITTSIGISSLRTEHDDYSMIFAEADEALYNAKELGRNRVEIFKEKIA